MTAGNAYNDVVLDTRREGKFGTSVAASGESGGYIATTDRDDTEVAHRSEVVGRDDTEGARRFGKENG